MPNANAQNDWEAAKLLLALALQNDSPTGQAVLADAARDLTLDDLGPLAKHYLDKLSRIERHYATSEVAHA